MQFPTALTLNLFGVMLNGLLILALFLLPLVGRCQAAAAPGGTPDSATTIRQLFWLRRQEAQMGLAVGCGSLAPGTGVSAPATSQLMLPPGAVAGLGTNCSLLTFFSRLRFSVRREQLALQRLALHRPLPGYVRRAIAQAQTTK